MALSKELLETEIGGIKANIIQWKRSIELNTVVLKAFEERYKKKFPKQKV